MSVTLTSLTVTPSWGPQKRLTLSGDPAVNEHVALRLVGCAEDTSVVFELSSEDGRTTYARFPWAAADSWTVDGDDLTATLNLKTDKLVAAFRGLGPQDRVTALATVASVTNVNLYAMGRHSLRNWVVSDADPVAYVSAIKVDIAALDERLTDAETLLGEHAHTGGADGSAVSHSSLTNKGTMTHTALEAALGSLTAAVNENVGAVATLGSRVDSVATAADAVAVDAPETDLDKMGLETITNSLTQMYNWIQGFKGGLT